MPSMTVSIDRAGRVVIPKETRDRLGLGVDAELEVLIEGDSVRLVPVRAPGRRYVMVDGFAVLEPISAVTVTDADIQAWRDADQR